MDIFFTDPSEIPLPPGEVRIRTLTAEPLPGGRRVRVYLETDPFQRRPNADLLICDSLGRELVETSIIEPMSRKMELVLHLRGDLPAGRCTLEAVLYYARLSEPDADQEPSVTERQEVDRAQLDFELNQDG
jgi:hypothetical protein